jgi:ribonuclease-3
MDIFEIEQALHLTFANKDLLQRALTHRSYLNENPNHPLEDNERLEFLGDAVLDFITGEYLYHRFPEMPEGRLTNLRSALVRSETLANFAIRLNLGAYLYMGRGEEESGGRERAAILGDAFEAIIGALYLDSGLEFTRQFVCNIIDPMLQDILASDADKDAKSRLQEVAQSHYKLTPTYRTVSEYGPDHAKQFTVEALIGGKVYGQGKGLSKQNAAQAAARAALQTLEAEVFNPANIIDTFRGDITGNDNDTLGAD